MAAANGYTNVGALATATANRTRLNTLHKLILFTNELVWGVGVTLDMLTEATFSGYARIATAFGLPFLDPVRGGASIQQLAQFNVDGTADPIVGNTIYGYAMIATPGGGADDYIVDGATFAGPVAMDANGCSLPLIVLENFGSNAS